MLSDSDHIFCLLLKSVIGADHLSQPRPGTLNGVAVDFALAVPAQIQGILTATVIDRLVWASVTISSIASIMDH